MKKVLFVFFGLLGYLMFASCSGVHDGVGYSSYDVNVSGPARLDPATFPDARFREVLSGSSYDRDQNGILDEEEIIRIRNVHCDNCGIRSLRGIEYLVELRGLYCTDNHIKEMNLANNKELQGVWCSGNDFTSLDFTPNEKLLWVYCFDCKLTNLNVRNNPELAYLECSTNPLGSLDVTHNPELEHLICATCGLSELDISKNPKLQHLDAQRNHFTHLDLTNCPLMKRLDIWDNPGLGSVDVSHCPGLQTYNCSNNGATEVDVTKNPELQKLICSYNHLSSLDVTKNPKLVYLDCGKNEIRNLDVSKNPKLKFLQAFTNPFTDLDISNCYSLVRAYNEGTEKYHANVRSWSWSINFGGDTSTGAENSFFLCFDKDNVPLTAKGSTSAPKPVVKVTSNKSNFMTKTQVVERLYSLAGSPKPGTLKEKRFTDINADSGSALIWAVNNGICADCTFYEFGVDDWTSREDAACMLMRYAEYKHYERAIDFGRTDPFIDYYDIDEYAWEAMTWAVTWNIMIGHGAEGAPKEERYLDPLNAITRTEFEEMINRMLEKNR